VKLEIADDDIPLMVRALEHYAAYLEAVRNVQQCSKSEHLNNCQILDSPHFANFGLEHFADGG